MVIFTRKDLQRIDVLDTEDSSFQQGFAESAKYIGRLVNGFGESAAHILHLRPLIIASVMQGDSAQFYPESPFAYSRSASCQVLERDKESGYTVLQCEDIENAALVLQYSYPKISENQGQVSIGYYKGKKAVDTEKTLPGSFEVNLGSQEVFSVISQDGKKHLVEDFKDLYERRVWPVAKRYFKPVRGHYFTYFREFEAKNKIEHSGLSGTRYWFISSWFYLNYYVFKTWTYVKTVFS